MPEETETRNVIEYKGAWDIFYNTAVVRGTGSSADSKGYTANIEYLGSKGRLIKASILDIDYISGNTYNYEATFTSDIDKYIWVKVLGEDQEEDVFANYTIFLQAGVPYKFSEDVTIDKEYDGRVDLIVEMGGRIGGEYLPTDTSLTIQMTDASFVGVAEKLKEIPTQKTTTQNTTSAVETTQKTTTLESTTEQRTTVVPAISETDKVTAPAKADIKKLYAKKKAAKKVKLSLKTIRGAKGYQLAVYTTKKNAKKNKKAIIKKNVKTTKVTITSKKLKNKKSLFVKVRAYVSDANGNKVYGKWSNVKKVKIKK